MQLVPTEGQVRQWVVRFLSLEVAQPRALLTVAANPHGTDVHFQLWGHTWLAVQVHHRAIALLRSTAISPKAKLNRTIFDGFF